MTGPLEATDLSSESWLATREQELLAVLEQLQKKLDALRRSQHFGRHPRLWKERVASMLASPERNTLFRSSSEGIENTTEGGLETKLYPIQRIIFVSLHLPSKAEVDLNRALSVTARVTSAILTVLASDPEVPVVWVGLEPPTGDAPPETPGAGTLTSYALTDALQMTGRVTHAPQLARTFVCVPMEPALASAFVAFAEEQLWSLLHYDFAGLFCGDLSIQDGWRAYCTANALFADTIRGLDIGPGDLLWIHDYPLMMLPGLVRRHLPHARIGFYLHTCFPSTEIFRIFPYRREMLESLLQSNLIGFQAFGYARHLVTASTRLLGVEGTYEKIVIEQRPAHACFLSIYPLGAGVRMVNTILESRAARRRIAELKERFQGRRIIVGLERLDDRFGGIDLKLAAFEEFLARNPLMRNQCVLVQVAVLEAHGHRGKGRSASPAERNSIDPSVFATSVSTSKRLRHGAQASSTRSGFGAGGDHHRPILSQGNGQFKANRSRTSTGLVADEDGRRQLIRTVCSLVGRINAVYGSLDASPVHFVNYEPSYEELLALFAVADVCLVSSVRSVMTPVAYEWTLCQHGRGEGPLVLSEFSGANRTFPSAMLVNPYDIEGVAFALQEALSLDARERKVRHEIAYQYVMQNTVKTWFDNFVEDLQVAAATDHQHANDPVPLPVSESQVAGSLAAARLPSPEASSADMHPEAVLCSGAAGERAEIAVVARLLELSQKKRLFILQHDGALMPFQAIAELAGPHPNVLRIVSVLATDPRNVVYLCSGRTRRIVTEWYQPYAHKFGFICEFGLFLRAPGANNIWTVNAEGELSDPDEWKPLMLPLMRTFADRTPGAIVEEAEHTLVWHYRDADPDFGKWQALELMEELGRILRSPQNNGLSLEVVHYEAVHATGGKWVRVGPRGVRKARTVERLLSELSLREFDFVLACGEDRHDDEMFETLQHRTSMSSVLVRIGRSSSGRSRAANLQLDSCREWLDALQQIVLGTPGNAPLVSTAALSPRRQESLPQFASAEPVQSGEATDPNVASSVDTLVYRRSVSEPRIGSAESEPSTSTAVTALLPVASSASGAAGPKRPPSLPRIQEYETQSETESS